jgi:vacuolar-type H+-ATPase subunit E/Vma4
MGIADIQKQILEEAEAEAEKLRQKAGVEVQIIEEQGHRAAKEKKVAVLAQARRGAEEKTRSILTPARLQAKKMVLEEKHRLLDEVFKGASEEVREANLIKAAEFLYG